jgi:hypothetical protein
MLRRFPETTETFVPSEDREALVASLPGCHCQELAVTKLPREFVGALRELSKVGVKIHPVFAALAGIEPDTRKAVATKKLAPLINRLLVNFLSIFIRPSDYMNM